MEQKPMQNDPSMDFTLEDIIREFGSDAPEEPEQTAPEAPAPRRPQKQPLRERLLGYDGGEAPEPEEEPEPLPEPEPEPAEPEESPEPAAPKRRRRARRPAPQAEKPRAAKPRDDLYDDSEYFALEAPEEDYGFSLRPARGEGRAPRKKAPQWHARSAQALLQDVSRGRKTLALRLRVCFVVTIVSALLTLYHGLGLHWISGFENTAALGTVLLVLLVVAAGSAWDVLAQGVRQFAALRLGAQALCLTTLVLALVEAILAVSAQRLPLCTVVSVQLLMALWANQLRRQALARSVKTLHKLGDSPIGVICSENVWKQHDGLYCTDGSAKLFEQHLEQPDLSERVMALYAPAALVLSLGLSVLTTIRGGANFFQMLALLLAVATPLGGFVCYVLPFSLLAQRLGRENAAFCGWYGAERYHRRSAIVLKDQDLFPEGTVHLSGVKVFDGYSSSRVLGYAAALLQAGESGLAPLLLDQLVAEGGRRPMAPRKLYRYEEAGLGGEFGPDSVLVGTLGFMKKMGVHMDGGTRVRQALYVSINGELAGLAAVQYTAAPDVRRGLQLIDRSGKLRPVLATRDFMITPALLKAKFKIRPEHIVRPNARERAELAARPIDPNSAQSALMSGYHFGTFAGVAVGGRLLKLAVQLGLLLALGSSLIGMILVTVIGCTGSVTVLSAFHLLLFLLVWLIPGLLLASWTRHY